MSTEKVEKSSKSSGVSSSVRPHQQLSHELREMAKLESSLSADDKFELTATAIDRIASAATEDDIFNANDSSLTSLKDAAELHNVPVNVFDVAFRTADEKYAAEGLGVYAVIRLLTDRGDEITTSTGAPNVVASLRQAQRIGLISEENPWRIVFTAKDTSNGTLLRVGRPKL